MHILIVEDEKRLADALCEILRAEKYMVDAVYNGKDGYDYAISGIYDLIILDIMLPLKNGFDVCSDIRKRKLSTPILILTAKDQVYDKVRGLDLGADDYMTKPFATDELLARIRTLTRRLGEVVLDELSYFDISFSISSGELMSLVNKKSVRLSYKEAEIIKLFLSKPCVIIPKEEIITKVWGYDSNASDNNVETYISFLRKKLDFVNSHVQILSLKKIGYKLEAPND
ncbi:MAG: response regulator transcription factor [Clostridia bacterium]|nr:response regulator transcription factor [Clostridia bacterium]